MVIDTKGKAGLIFMFPSLLCPWLNDKWHTTGRLSKKWEIYRYG
jgi:hypothetical protein